LSHYQFHLKGTSGETLLTSGRYATEDAARAGITAARVNSQIGARYQKRESRNRAPYFVLRDPSGEVIATSELYSSLAARESGIQLGRWYGATTAIENRIRPRPAGYSRAAPASSSSTPTPDGCISSDEGSGA
jgi:uncharacterized protein YegP (UPF0339 family)